eukprot:CAMPEP_0172311854 /NCGR_PEP_ID=MMETSP1058-20130122/15811_1 /TAXON_ID=83371 /ORGANISM="Detonula confervacea, Strain CCMP 353" /LENGTH=500 /DNA_ID=CAMNT_0013025149 /DNA_START=71 /DNA_END=1573 /DNA_ORIENTATION=+
MPNPNAPNNPPDGRMSMPQIERESQRIEQETERLHKDVEKLKRLRRLKQEEKELKRWMARQDAADQKPQVRNSDASANRDPTPSSDAPGYFHEPPPSSLGLKQIRKKSTPTRYNNAKRHDAGNGDDNSNVDVESQSKSSPTPSPFRRALIKSRSIFVASSKKWCRREVFPTARKVGMAILTGIDDETLQREDTERILIVITLIKEATFGILIAFAVVSLVLLLDHRLLLNLPTARNFRRATFHLMNDKETLRNFEENSGLKFMEMEEYAFMLDEIGKAANKTKFADDIFMTRSEDMVQMEKESKEYEQLISELRTSSGIDKFCPECIWSKKITCKQRGEALEKSNQLSKYQAMLAAMEDGLCLGEDHRFPRSKQQKAEEDELLVDWGESKQDFCRGCEWDKSTSCYHRLAHIHNTYGTSPRRAGAMIMVQQPWCRKSFHAEENKRLEKFCEDCVWGWEGKSMRTCVQQAEFLQRMHGYPESAVRLSVMERPACSYGQTGI